MLLRLEAPAVTRLLERGRQSIESLKSGKLVVDALPH